MRRRDFLKTGALGVGGASIASLPSWTQSASKAADCEVDVLVIGGGTAGTIAAVQAARAKARTMLVEMGGQLGGATTVGGVAAPGLFHAWGKQIIAGIGWELVSKTVALDRGKMPDFTKPVKWHWLHQVPINGQLYAALAEEACLAAGVSLCYYEFPTGVAASDNGWLVHTVGKGVHRDIACRELIDCTGGADIVGMLGLPRSRGDETQPGSLIFAFDNYDASKLDAALIRERYRQAIAKGVLLEGDCASGDFLGFLQNGGKNQQHVFGADSSSAATKTLANLAGRASVLRLLRFVRSLPGCEHALLAQMQQETAVRETYRIVGEVEITADDYTSGRLFDDAVAYSFYPVDLHDRRGVKPKMLQHGVVPTIPLRALTPKASRHLLVAGRSVSSDRLANSGLRVQASCMAMGQAAGAAAALAVRQNTTPGKVPLKTLCALLRQHDAIVPEAKRDMAFRPTTTTSVRFNG
jgi:hypothetical protein